MSNELIKFDVDEALDTVDLTFAGYKPSLKSLEFFNYIRIFTGQDFEIDTPMWHYFLVDLLLGEITQDQFPYSREVNSTITVDPTAIAILAARGAAKSTVTTLFYPIYASILGKTPVTGPLSHILILSDSQQGGSTSQARVMASAFEKSAFAKEWFETMRFTDTEIELVRKDQGKGQTLEQRHMLIKFKGAQALSLDSKLYMDDRISCIADCRVGDRIYGADGKLCTIVKKSEIFNKPMYKIVLKDGRELKVSEDHINSVLYKQSGKYIAMDKTTTELLDLPMWIDNATTGYRTPRIWIKNCEPVQYTEKSYSIDPYTLGLILGDGYFHVNDGSVKLSSSASDFNFYKTQIPYEIGYIETRGTNVVATIKGISSEYRLLGLDSCKAPSKFIPNSYKVGSIEQRLALLQGLMDTDGTVAEGRRGTRFMTTSAKLCEDVMDLVRSLGGRASCGISHYKGDDTIIKGVKAARNHDVFRVYIKLDMVPVRLPRKVDKVVEFKSPDKVAVVSIERIEDESSQCIAVDNEDRQFLTTNYTRTHNTGGIRSGSRNPVTGDRYALIVADDVIKNEDEAYSEAIMEKVKTALESDAENAMRSKNTQMIIINTPFHKQDPLYKIVEGGAYTPLAMPICKEITLDLKRESFIGLWEESHSYDSIMKRWRKAVANNNTRAFNQELMLRVANEEDRMISDDMIQWYDRTMLLKLIDGYNLYITTDFTTTSSSKSDFSAIVVWALGSNGDWFLLDVSLKRMELLEQYETLFRMISIWGKSGRYIEVGVEIDGQQKAHLFSLTEMMQKRNVYFSFARQKGAPIARTGILSKAGGSSKLERFRYTLPLFQNMKFHFPEQLKDIPDLVEGIKQIKGVTHSGFTRKDDFCDAVSQLAMMETIAPTAAEDLPAMADVLIDSSGIWTDISTDRDEHRNSLIF